MPSIAFIVVAVVLCGTAAHAQPIPPTQNVPITGDRLSGFVLPIEPIETELVMSCEHARRWKVDDTQRLLLEGDVTVDIGSYAFAADTAVVWINRLPSDRGLVNQISIWFPNVSEPTRRAGLGASGRDVLVTASTLGAIRLRPVLMDEGPPSKLGVVRDAEARLSRYLKRIVRQPLPSLRTRPRVQSPPVIPPPVLTPGGDLGDPKINDPNDGLATITLPKRTSSSLPIFLPQGVLSFSADEVIIDESTDSVTVLGSVLIHYDSRGARDSFQTLSMAAKRGVVFLRPGTVAAMRQGSGRVEAEAVRGMYLEGGVRVTDGNYTLRSARVYYDLQRNRALAINAILRTYDRLIRARPMHARAEEMRQVSANEWTADKATISTSEFFEPHISIGMEQVSITERPDGEGGLVQWTRGRNLTLRANGMPFFYWPTFEGTAESSPLRSVRSGWDRFRGFELGTKWDLYGLLGLEPPRAMEAELQIDGFVERGPAGGVDLSLSGIGNVPGSGTLKTYLLYDLGGTDRTAGGYSVNVAAGVRGEIVGEYRADLSVDLMLETQLSYLSDQTWVSAWRRGEYWRRREYESSAYLDWSPNNTSLSLLVKGELNDFLSNGWKIASRPYFVEKVPELSYARAGDDLWNVFTSTTEVSLSRMSLRTTSGSPDSLGIRQTTFAAASNSVQVADLYSNAGYRDNDVLRFHTRQEFAIPLSGDGWNVTPYLFGRFTGYLDGEFGAYRQSQGLDPNLKDQRVMAGGGVRSSMRFVQIHNDAQDQLFNINRLRHIIEPNATLFYGWDSHPNGAFPIYDQAIEGASAGAAAQIGLTQTLQTQRGGAGNWQSVDMLVVDAGAVINDSANDFQRIDVPDPAGGAGAYDAWAWVQSPYPQFYRYRPELSQWGSHAYSSIAWRLSNTFLIGSSGIWSWNDRTVIDMTSGTAVARTVNGLLRGSIGIELTHTPDASSYLEYRYLGASDDEILQGGVLYRIGKRYQLTASPQWDVRRGEFRAFSASLLRTFPDFDLRLNVRYDLILDETTVGLRLTIPAQARAGLMTY